MKSILLASALALSPFVPAYCEGSSAQEIIARARAKLAEQEAVLLNSHHQSEYIVVAARDRKIEGTLVILRHIIGRDADSRVYYYYKSGSQTPLLKMPYTHYEFSIEETIALRDYYCARGQVKTLASARPQAKSLLHKGAKHMVRKKA